MRFTRGNVRLWVVAVFVSLLSACAGRAFQPQPEAMTAIESRAESQTDGAITVRVSVPSPEETRAIFDLPLYDRNVQPVWVEVDNRGDTELRYSPVGTDPEYVPPFEVAYTHKQGFSADAYEELENYLHGHVMPRFIPAGEVRSGFIFTQARPGTKGVNIDLYGPVPDEDYNLVFFVPVPGFVADHAQVNFDALYSSTDITHHDLDGLREALEEAPCCAVGRSGTGRGDPLNVTLVGDGDDVLQALLRAGWFERLAQERNSGLPTDASYLFGRPADAVFRTDRPGTGARSELRLWMAPMRVSEQEVWLGDVINFVTGPDGTKGLDPDIDDARDYLIQDLWYSQSLAALAWLRGDNVATIDEPGRDLQGSEYFTDGYRAVAWPTGTPVSLLEAEFVPWDEPPSH